MPRTAYLVYDTRERGVELFIEQEFTDIKYLKSQIQTGDYHICIKNGSTRAPTVAACIERKTYDDFAASFTDGRYANLDKLLALRAKTGCQLYYIIEGPAFPSPNRRFHRIPYSNILGAITKLMVRHGIMIVQTENPMHTAVRLYQLTKAFVDEPECYSYPVDAKYAIAGDADDADDADNADAPADAPEDDEKLTVPDVVNDVLEESSETAVAKVWSRLKGVTLILGGVLCRTISVAGFARKEMTVDALQKLRSAGNRPLHKGALSALLGLRAGGRGAEEKILSGVRGVGVPAAKALLESAGGLAALLSRSAETMAIMAIPRGAGSAKLGVAKAARITTVLNFALTAEEPKNAAAATAPVPPADHIKAQRFAAVPPAKIPTAPAKADAKSKPLTPASATVPVKTKITDCAQRCAVGLMRMDAKTSGKTPTAIITEKMITPTAGRTPSSAISVSGGHMPIATKTVIPKPPMPAETKIKQAFRDSESMALADAFFATLC